jgi:hypothetical protein
MTSSNTLKKLVSIGAAMLIAVGGSLVAAEPAHAAVLTYDITADAYTSAITIVLKADGFSCPFAAGGSNTASQFTYKLNGASTPAPAISIVKGTSSAKVTMTITETITPTDTVSVSVPAGITCDQTTFGAVTDQAAAVVVNPPTSAGTLPTITGTASVGSTLTAATPGSWNYGAVTYQYQWATAAYTNGSCQSSFQNVSGATLDHYVVQTGDSGSCVTVKVKGVNAAGTAAVMPANALAVFIPVAIQAPQTYSVTDAPTYRITGSVATAFDGTWSGGTPVRYWLLCTLAHPSPTTSTVLTDCSGLSLTQSGQSEQGLTLNLPTQAWIGPTLSRTQVTVADYFLLLRVSNGMSSYNTSTSGSTPPVVTPSVTEAAKPLPVWAAPILKQIPTLSKTLNTDGGKVSLTDGDFSSLKTVTVGGKEVTFSTDAKGNVNIPIPAGKAGTTADLVVTFTGGKMVIQDGIKYVAPTDVAKVAEAGVAGFKANSSKVSGALAASILYAAQIDHKANAIACSGYAASKAQVALATARAQAACDYATGAYSNLTKSTVAVIVNKAKAKSASVGIKVYH